MNFFKFLKHLSQESWSLRNRFQVFKSHSGHLCEWLEEVENYFEEVEVGSMATQLACNMLPE
jgi:hypothetical protein